MRNEEERFLLESENRDKCNRWWCKIWEAKHSPSTLEESLKAIREKLTFKQYSEEQNRKYIPPKNSNSRWYVLHINSCGTVTEEEYV